MKQVVELISTGSELLSGRTVNRHAQVLGEKLSTLGLELARDTTVPDDLGAIHDAVREALARVDVVVISGGLGPTSDDLTRDAVAKLLGRHVIMDEASRREIRERYRSRGRSLNAAGERQALVVEGAVALSNQVGAAPGERLELDGQVLFILPGPPREFLFILETYCLPWLRNRFGEAGAAKEKIYQVSGLGESDIVTRFEAAGFPPEKIDMAYCASPGRVEVRARAADGDTERLDCAARQVRQLLGEHIYTEGRLGIEEVTGRRLAELRKTLATAESCTGGMLGHLITSVSGSSAYYLGGVVAYANAAKIRELGVSEEALQKHGAVSEETARQMAAGVRTRFGADYGIGVTGIAGPTGGTPEKPVGLVYIALADESASRASRFQFPGDRDWVKEWSCRTALDLLRRRIQNPG